MELKPSSERSIGESYDGKNVLITGSTGFIGKTLLAKLLQTCPGISKVVLLIRSSKNGDPYVRLKKLLQSPLFDSLKDNNREICDKIIPIESDIALPNLGINVNQQAVLKQLVNVVFHCAATVSFDPHLKESVDINLLGTQRLMEFCKQMVHLEAVVHLSTAYSNCDHSFIKEEIYPPSVPVDLLVSITENLNNSMVEAIKPHLLEKKPNTYTFTKSLAESWLSANCENLPVVIVRPSITLGIFEGPIPGWVENMNGPTGFIVAVAKGVVRIVLTDSEKVADFIPVDMVANLTIAAAWKVAHSTRTKEMCVYNICSGPQNPISWGKFLELCLKHSRKYINCHHIFGANTTLTKSDTYYKICRALFQMFPSYLIDFNTIVTGGNPRMLKIQEKIRNALKHLEPFYQNDWTFEDDNVRNLHLSLSKEDKVIFPFDVTQINWDTYFENYVLGIRRFILKEEDIQNKL